MVHVKPIGQPPGVTTLIDGGTVDYDVLPAAPGALLAFPIMSVQNRLDIPVAHQSAVSDLFVSKCLFGGEAAGAAAAAAAVVGPVTNLLSREAAPAGPVFFSDVGAVDLGAS